MKTRGSSKARGHDSYPGSTTVKSPYPFRMAALTKQTTNANSIYINRLTQTMKTIIPQRTHSPAVGPYATVGFDV